MQPIHIFKTGKHTSSNGTSLEFSDSMLEACVEAYDPTKHEAPIVVGHPKDNGPAYGWVDSMQFDEGNVYVTPKQVNLDFEEQVKAGAYKHVSASFYTPDHPGNPVPGGFYLRHVGFLGAQPPAIKGLEAIQFNDGEGEVVEFMDAWMLNSISNLFRRLRDFFIEEFGMEKADSVLPDYLVDDVRDTARDEINKGSKPEPAFSEPSEDDDMKELEQAKARITELETENTELKGKVASFEEREAELAEREAQMVTAGHESFCDELIAEGRLLPAQKASTVAFMGTLAKAGDEATVDFTEGEGDDAKTVKLSQLDAYKKNLKAAPKQVDFGERAGAEHEEAAGMTADELAQRAQDYQESEAQHGRHITTSQAVAAVKQGKDKQAA